VANWSHLCPAKPPRHTSYLTRHTSHVTQHTSHNTLHNMALKHLYRLHRRDSLMNCRKSLPCSKVATAQHITRQTSHLTHHNSHTTRDTSKDAHETYLTSLSFRCIPPLMAESVRISPASTCHTSHLTTHTSNHTLPERKHETDMRLKS
jgi:hypothetical protein